ncbi:putative CENPB DNA-binding domain-containing protein 1 [Onthophagus taurus]|uniref:putative CENPB DNA-binding domain-containing protein 1 n=1 Tax=Onthophagus taurus TaxID=166361 RepID=UPI0039BE6AED
MSGKIVKKTKSTVSLGKKLEILRRFDAGEKADIARILPSLPVTTIRSICNRDAEKIREAAKHTNSFMAQQIVKGKCSLIMLMESLLSTWIKEQNQRKIPLSRTNIQEKALSIFEELKSKPEHVHKDETFHESRDWFQKFKSRAKLHNVALKAITDSSLC